MVILKLEHQVSQQMVATAGIAGPSSVVRELLDNSVDACDAQEPNHIYIEVDDTTGGLEYITVRDSGIGIQSNDREMMCLNNTTSKIESMTDLERNIHTCGFRGEALYLICQLAQSVQITTKTKDDATADVWNVGNDGKTVRSIRKVPAQEGTTIKVKGLFGTTPVRHNFLKKARKKSIQQIRDMVFAYALIYNNIKFHLKFVKLMPNGNITTTENATFVNTDDAAKFMRTELGIMNASALFTMNGNFPVVEGSNHIKYNVTIKCVFPKGTASDGFTSKKSAKVLNVNNRMLKVKLNFGKEVDKVVNDSFNEIMLIAPQLWYIHLTIPNEFIDVNIEPEKSDVLVNEETLMLSCLKQFLKSHLYDVHKDTLDIPNTKIDISNFEEDEEEDISMIQTLNSVVDKVQHETYKAFDIEKDLQSDDDCSVPVKHSLDGYVNDASDNIKPTLTSSSNTLLASAPSKVDADLVEPQVYDEDNDWSRSMFDTTISSEHELASEPLLDDEQASETNVSMLNPWTITDMANEMRGGVSKFQDHDNAHVKPTKQSGQLDESCFETPPQVKQSPLRVTKPVSQSLGQYLTHNIDASPRKKVNKKAKIQSALSFNVAPIRVSELAQHLQNDTLVTNFDPMSDVSTTIFEELWSKRKGFPSSILIEGATELYKAIGYSLETNSGSRPVNKYGLVVYS